MPKYARNSHAEQKYIFYINTLLKKIGKFGGNFRGNRQRLRESVAAWRQGRHIDIASN
jgi:hypothetical protein